MAAFSRRRITAALIALLVLVFGGWLIKDVFADDGSRGESLPGSSSGLDIRGLSTLPDEATDTWESIQSGGPYRYPARDDTVFGNREGQLPHEELGYYREYTVPTPGSSDRGGRRLITGRSAELYYTGDHYASFVVVDPNR